MVRRVIPRIAARCGILSTGGYPPVEYPADIRRA